MDLNQLIKNVTLTKVCSIKPDKDSDDSKQITIKVKFDGVPLQGVFDKAVSQSIIQWQNGPGRNKFDTWANNQVVEIDFKSPARTTVDPVAQLLAEATAAGIDTTDKNEMTKFILSKLNK